MKAIVLEKEQKVFESDSALYVIVPSESGEICVYPDHMSIITLMMKGIIHINFNENGTDNVKDIQIPGGIFSFKNNEAVFLIDPNN